MARSYGPYKRQRFYRNARGGFIRPLLRALPGAFNAARKAVSAYRSVYPKRRVQTTVERVFKRDRPARRRHVTKGSLYKAFRTRRKTAKSSTVYSKQGAILHYQHGGVLASSDCVWVGHASTPDDLSIRVVIMAMLRKLFKLYGMEFKTFGEKLQDPTTTAIISPGEVWYTYQLEETGAQLKRAVVIAANSTLDTLVTAVKNDFYTSFAAGRSVQLIDMWFVAADTASILVDVPNKLSLNNATLELACSSRLAVQNRTLASSAVGNDETNRNDIANNPLVGKYYRGKGTGLQYIMVNDTAPQESLVANPASGRIQGLPANMSTEQVNIYRRPIPGRNLKGCIRESGIFLNPGNIRSSKLYKKTIISVSNYFTYMTRRFNKGATGNIYTGMGNCAVMCVQKRCDTGVDEPNISVGYEIEGTMQCVVKRKTPDIAPEIKIIV